MLLSTKLGNYKEILTGKSLPHPYSRSGW